MWPLKLNVYAVYAYVIRCIENVSGEIALSLYFESDVDVVVVVVVSICIRNDTATKPPQFQIAATLPQYTWPTQSIKHAQLKQFQSHTAQTQLRLPPDSKPPAACRTASR